jgi:hypothetical protein
VTVPVDERRRMDVAALRRALAGVGQQGLVPMAVVATAGTTVDRCTITLAFIAAMVLVIESILRQKVIQLLVNVAIILALVTAAILVWEFFWWLMVIITVAVATLIITDNIRELWR